MTGFVDVNYGPRAAAPTAGIDITVYRAVVSAKLSALLASTYHLALKSHLYHWAMVGPAFAPLHDITEQHYSGLREGADAIADRLEALGLTPPLRPSFAADFSSQSPKIPLGSPLEIMQDLISDHEAMLRMVREADHLADDAGDVASSEILFDRLAFHTDAVAAFRATLAN